MQRALRRNLQEKKREVSRDNNEATIARQRPFFGGTGARDGSPSGRVDDTCSVGGAALRSLVLIFLSKLVASKQSR